MKLPSAALPKRLALLAAFLLPLAGCQATGEGTEIPNEVYGRTVLVGGDPAADVEVLLVPVGHLPGATGYDSLGVAFATRTDDRGQYAFQDVPRGRYNVIAARDSLRSFRDSVAMTGRALELPPDTLRAAGTLFGEVRLQPQHDPRSAIVQVLGTHSFFNVERDGRFALRGLGAGRYRLRVTTTEDGYTPLHAEAEIRAGRLDSLPEPLVPFFSDIPVVTAFQAIPDATSGSILLTWENPDFDKVHSYLLYRDEAGALLPSEIPHARVFGRSFVDTIYSLDPRPGQHLFTDTVARRYEYRIKILDLSGIVGPSFGFLPVTAIPPTRVSKPSGWRRAASGDFLARTQASLVVAQDRLWLLGGAGSQGRMRDVWTSSDGEAWERVLESVPFLDTAGAAFRTVALRDSLWALVFHTSTVPSGDSAGFTLQERLKLWVSGDGSAWTRVSDSVPIPAPHLHSLSFAAAGGRLWILGGPQAYGPVRTFSSGNGRDWTPLPAAEGALAGPVSVTSEDSVLHALDTARTLWRLDPDSPGTPWRVERPGLEFHREGLSVLQAHDGRLWVLNGSLGGNSADQIWVSDGGRQWSLFSAHAPFGARAYAATATFKGKLWIAGGGYGGQGPFGDIWSLDQR